MEDFKGSETFCEILLDWPKISFGFFYKLL